MTVSILLVLGLATSACTGLAPDPGGRSRSVRAAAAATLATTAHFTLRVRSSEAEGDEWDMRAFGTIDYQEGSASMVVRLGSGDGHFGFVDEVRALDRTFYVRQPGHYAGRPWARLSGSGELDPDAQIAFGAVFLVALAEHAGRPGHVGTVTTSGTSVERVRCFTDPFAAVRDLIPAQRAAFVAAMRAFPRRHVPTTIWLGGDRIQHVALRTWGTGGAGATSGNQGSGYSMTLVLVDLGAPAEVTPPPESSIKPSSLG